MKKSILITSTGEVCPIEGKLHLEKAALLLKSFNGLSKTATRLDPTKGDLGALHGELDNLYPFEGFTHRGSTLILLPKKSDEPNSRAKKALEKEYKVFDTLPTGNVIITSMQDCMEDLIHFINRQIETRGSKCPTYLEGKELIYKERLLNMGQYVKFVEKHPELNLPYRPDFFYNNGLD